LRDGVRFASIPPMPTYDYRCQSCGHELELVHRISELVSRHDHVSAKTQERCDGPLERLISAVGVASSVGTKPPSDAKLERLGFTKYVRGDKGYEKAFGNDVAPSRIDRD
jgi:putative FmdB family regulatory protein